MYMFTCVDTWVLKESSQRHWWKNRRSCDHVSRIISEKSLALFSNGFELHVPAQPETSAYPVFVKWTWIFHKRKYAVCWKWDYLLCHFATSDTIKHHQGLSKLWGRDENFTTDMAVIHCAFTGRLCMALSAGSQGNDTIVVVGQSFPVAFSYVIFP